MALDHVVGRVGAVTRDGSFSFRSRAGQFRHAYVEWSRARRTMIPEYAKLTLTTDIYNDFAGYGIQEVIENQFLLYDKAKTLEERWMAVTALTYFLACIDVGPWYMQDDGERTAATASMIGVIVLHALSMMAKAKQLKRNNEKFKDIPIVMALV